MNVNKGKFTAENTDYKAVNGKLTKGEKIKLYDADGKEITCDTSTSKKVTTTAPVAP